MKTLQTLRFGLCFFIALLCFLPFFAFARPVITEVMWMGSDLSTSDEWIEMTSIEADTDLSGFTLTSVNTSGKEVVITRFATGTVLPLNDHRVIAKFGAADSRLLEEPWLTSSTMTLPNSRLLLRLRDASGVIVDQADDGTGAPLAGENPSGGTKASMERTSLSGCGALAINWASAIVMNGFDNSSPLLGTPGHAFSQSSSSSSSSSSNSNEYVSYCSNSEHIFVSEILPDAEGNDTDGEWIEIYNPDSERVDLHGFTLETQGGFTKTLPQNFVDSQGYLLIQTSSIGLSLSNAGGSLILRDSDTSECDRVTYPKPYEGVSYGRDALDNQWKHLCYVTPNAKNEVPAWNPEIAIESGSRLGIGKVKMNALLTKVEGFAGSVQCTVDFGDGQKGTTCNPGMHTYSTPGSYSFTIQAVNACGTTVTRTQQIEVLASTQTKSSTKGVQVTSMVLDLVLADIPLVISAALPNPQGDDKGHEWVEVTNSSKEPVSITGLTFGAGKKASKKLGQEVFEPRERKRYIVSLLGISLGNEDSGIELRSPQGEVISKLNWGQAREGVVYRFSSNQAGVRAKVVKVIDGDTFDVLIESDTNRKETVRLIGVDAPETVDPKKPVQPFGIEARNYLLSLILNKKIELEFDTNERDYYGRLLAYAFLPGQVLVQELMIKQGLTRADEQYLYTKKEEFKALQDQAKDAQVGLWSVASKSIAKSKSSSSKKSSSSSSKKTITAKSKSQVASTYESKVTYQNVRADDPVTESGGVIDSEDLYASLIPEAHAAEEVAPEVSNGISASFVVVIILVNAVTVIAAIGGGIFVGTRLHVIRGGVRG